jgi:spore maturation protein CgeB
VRILTVEPGPNFSVQDVHTGWFAALQRAGVDVRNFALSDRLSFQEAVLKGKVPDDQRPHIAARMVAEQLRGCCYDFWPDLVLITSAFFVPPDTYDIIRARGTKVAVLLTESPYEDPAQLGIAARADLVLLNDPTNLDQFRQINPRSWYVPHAYDPQRHRPAPASPDLKCDFGWVGTAYESRMAFFEAVDWDGIDAAFAGNWERLPDDSKLVPFLVHERGVCFENSDTVDLYNSCKASVNLYRKETLPTADDAGWAMGPREVELAACGTFFLREPRGESDAVLHMLPTFDSPADFEDKLRWWLTHDNERERLAAAAQEAVADRTFDQNVRSLLERI